MLSTPWLAADVVTLYQPIEELGVGKHGSVRAFASATDSVKFAVKRPLHPNKNTIHKLKVEKTFFEKAYPDTEVLFEEVDTLDCRLVMPLFPGKDFHDTLKSYPHRTDEVIVAVALELHRLHLLRMQHGDIKFDNIIITEKNGIFDVKFIDFGFAYNTPGLARILAGKCEYFPPERTEATDQTQVAAQFSQDIYSFGFMLEFAKKIIKIPEKFNDFIKATQNKNPASRPGLQSFLYKNLLPTTLNNRNRNFIIKHPDSYQTMRVIGLTGDDLNRALNNVPQFESCYQKLTEINLSQQACIHRVLNNITGFNQSYLCLKAIRDETQQVYQEVKAELGSESQIHDLSNRFKQYQSQAMQAAFDYLMAKEPSLQQLTEQLSQYESDLITSTSFKSLYSGSTSVCAKILEKIRTRSHKQTTADTPEPSELPFFSQQQANTSAASPVESMENRPPHHP